MLETNGVKLNNYVAGISILGTVEILPTAKDIEANEQSTTALLLVTITWMLRTCVDVGEVIAPCTCRL